MLHAGKVLYRVASNIIKLSLIKAATVVYGSYIRELWDSKFLRHSMTFCYFYEPLQCAYSR